MRQGYSGVLWTFVKTIKKNGKGKKKREQRKLERQVLNICQPPGGNLVFLQKTRMKLDLSTRLIPFTWEGNKKSEISMTLILFSGECSQTLIFAKVKVSLS